MRPAMARSMDSLREDRTKRSGWETGIREDVRAGGSTRRTWAFEPPMPNELTPAALGAELSFQPVSPVLI